MTGSATAGGGRCGGYTAGVRALALLFALLVPAGQVLAALHLHCALEHPLGHTTPHAAGPELSQLHGYGQGHGHGHEQVHERQREQAHEHEHPHEHPHEHEPAAAADVEGDHSTAHPEIASGHVKHADGSGIATLFDEHHHHHDDATGSHSCCCIGGAAGAIVCTDGRIGVDVHTQRFDLPVPSGAYDSPFHEPPPRPQWRLHAPV